MQLPEAVKVDPNKAKLSCGLDWRNYMVQLTNGLVTNPAKLSAWARPSRIVKFSN